MSRWGPSTVLIASKVIERACGEGIVAETDVIKVTGAARPGDKSITSFVVECLVKPSLSKADRTGRIKATEEKLSLEKRKRISDAMATIAKTVQGWSRWVDLVEELDLTDEIKAAVSAAEAPKRAEKLMEFFQPGQSKGSILAQLILLCSALATIADNDHPQTENHDTVLVRLGEALEPLAGKQNKKKGGKKKGEE